MRPRHPLRGLAAALAALIAVGAAAGAHDGLARAASPGLIVFTSDRVKLDPGEIWSLAPGSAPRDISRSPAADYGVAVAPVGDAIAFWSERSGRTRLYLAHGDGTHLRAVAGPQSAAGENGGDLAFSADGAQLFGTLFSGGAAHAFSVRVATAAARSLRPCPGLFRPAPAGDRVACARLGTTTVSGLDGRVRFRVHGWDALWSSAGALALAQQGASAPHARATTLVLDARGRTTGTLAGQALAWSPDGRWLVFERDDRTLWAARANAVAHPRELLESWAGAVSFTAGGRSVSTADASGAAVDVPLAGGPATPGLAAGRGVESAQGRLAYVVYPTHYPLAPGFRMSVVITDARGGRPRVAGRFPFDDHGRSELAWLPGGRRVLYTTSTACGGDGLFTVSSMGGATRSLTSDPRELSGPSWSPDGTRIAYSAEAFGCHNAPGEPIAIETRAADGTGVQTVTGGYTGDGFDTDPAYRPDGRRIAYAHSSFTTTGMQQIDVGGSTREVVPRAQGAPVWSPDGARIAFVSGRGIAAVPAAGGARVVLAKGLPAQTCGTGLAWSPDGRQLALGGTARGIYLITLGSPASVRLAVAVRCAENPSFSPDGTALAFDAPTAHGRGGQTSIMVANADGAGVRTLSTAPFRHSVDPSWQPIR
ncbi:MAG TPA: hypothetical protein VGK92_00100 [Gaiellales bacterium]